MTTANTQYDFPTKKKEWTLWVDTDVNAQPSTDENHLFNWQKRQRMWLANVPKETTSINLTTTPGAEVTFCLRNFICHTGTCQVIIDKENGRFSVH